MVKLVVLKGMGCSSEVSWLSGVGGGEGGSGLQLCIHI